MADRALRPDDRLESIVELDKDERWQARLAEARVRREIALREKANGDGAPKPRRKPWEEEGASEAEFVKPIEPILEESDDDKIDFYDRVKTLRETTERRGDNSPPPGWVEFGHTPSDIAPEKPVARTSVAERYISDLSPDFEPVKPYVPVVRESRAPKPAPVVRPDPEPSVQNDGPAFLNSSPATFETPVAPKRVRRRGVPLGLLAGVCVLAVLPFTTEVRPLEKGPSAGNASTFGLQPALGITSPMNEVPRTTIPGEWAKVATDRPVAPPAFLLDGSVARASPVAPMGDAPPSEAAFGPLDWSSLGPTVESVSVDAIATPWPDTLPGAPEAVPGPDEQAAAVVTYPEPLSDLRVTILVPSTGNVEFANEIAQDVQNRGHELAAITPVNIKISERNVRFYHAGDRGEAERLADAYGARLRDFTSFRPTPADGTLEIWLVGERIARSVATRPVRQVRPEPVAPVAPSPRVIIVQRSPSFLDRLAGALGGGHVEGAGPVTSGGGSTLVVSDPVTTDPPAPEEPITDGGVTEPDDPGTGTDDTTGDTGSGSTDGTEEPSDDTGSEPGGT